MDSMYSTAREMVIALLREDAGPNLTVNVIRECAEQALALIARRRHEQPRDGMLDELVKDLETDFNVWIGTPQILDSNIDHVPWLHNRREEIDWAFWSRYRSYATSRFMSPSAVNSLEQLTDEVLARLEDPDRSGAWDRRGLVVGHVQSGKTANYTGLICKATDAGYRLIVVLAGMHSNLRAQTQARLDEGFLGYMSSGVDGPRQPVGVGLINPRLAADSVTQRDDNGDFNRAFAKHFNIAPGQQPLLFVVKKNGRILQNLVNWVQGFANATEAETGRRYVRGVPLLVIDDEADQASVNTGAADEQPKRINSLIRQLLYTFEQSGYVGYTATPFANIFINELRRTDLEGPDLFPESFIVSLPVPSNYIGPARVFGLDGDPEAGIEPSPALPLVRDADDGRDWLPQRHRKTHRPTPPHGAHVPQSLHEAILAFILAGAAKAARGLDNEHHSMLVHVTRFVGVQGLVAEQVGRELESLRRRIVYGDGSGPDIELELRSMWEQDFLPTTITARAVLAEADPYIEPIDWAAVRPHVRSVVEAIVVSVVNGTSADALQYDDHRPTGLKVIAVGGDKLSRGLTLEGLSVSYFLRSSRMYDTLMQMGRWFGYRPRYADLCRLYLPHELIDWFEHITEAGEELRRELDHMKLIGGTPRDYGLRVRTHPTLLVTSQVKMREGTRLRLSFAGQVSETVVFRRDAASIRRNLAATMLLLDDLGEPQMSVAGKPVWTTVPASTVTRFLRQYQTHPLAWRADSGLLAKYIDEQQKREELVEWTVCLAASSSRDARRAFIGNREIGMIRREDSKHGPFDDRLVIRRILSPADEAADLSQDEFERARQMTIVAALDRGLEPVDPTRASGRSIREVRPPRRGLLIIYPLDPHQIGQDESIEDKKTPVVGFALSFPDSQTAHAVDHVVNHVYYKQYYGENDWSEDEDEESR